MSHVGALDTCRGANYQGLRAKQRVAARPLTDESRSPFVPLLSWSMIHWPAVELKWFRLTAAPRR